MEIDDLTVLVILEIFSRLTKYVSCLIIKVQYVTVANLKIIRYTTENQINQPMQLLKQW